MPTAPIFLEGRRILRANDGAAKIETRDADVAADAFADVLDAALVNLARQPRVGDRRAGTADDVERARPDDAHNLFGFGYADGADQRNLGYALDLSFPGRLVVAL